MLFSSTVFLFIFLPITLLVSFLSPNIKLKNIFLLFASLFFYAWGEGELVFLMLFVILINYSFGLAIDQSKNKKKIYLISAVVINLGLLGYYKYSNFIIDNFNILLFNIGSDTVFHEEVALPIGISFFIFQSISYVADVYRKEGAVQKNPLDLALYISLFPQLIAGPIVRYHDVFKQIEYRTIDTNKVAQGIKRFIIGLGKKVLIANTCGLVADQIFGIESLNMNTSVAWLGIICYSFQIFFDFSGYSDMAIGLGKMLGFDFLENFNFPYVSRSIKEFWRRWHISLSTWFRDYLYIPLGGSKKGTSRTYVNLVIVFFLTGLWHGASWNFIVWGMIHGLFLIFERLGLSNILNKIPRFISHIYTLFIVIVAWVFFRSDDLTSSLNYLEVMFGIIQAEDTIYPLSIFITPEIITTLVAAAIFSIPNFQYISKKSTFIIHNITLFKQLNNLMLITIFILSIASVASGTHNPFIYFRF